MAANTSAVESLGRVGLPAPVTQLASATWDVIVVGAGHNGLACAAYLALAGKRVGAFRAAGTIEVSCRLKLSSN
jgi:NADPH-dependent glutamate synthase beta subunit-like oxidoreductase